MSTHTEPAPQQNSLQTEPTLSDPCYYLSRELSLLAFHQHIFELAQDHRLPLLERLRFLFISAQSLDEFFEIRVAQLKEHIALGRLTPDHDGSTPVETLKKISQRVQPLVQQQYTLFNDTLLPMLAEEGICFSPIAHLTTNEQNWAQNYFKTEIQPILSPIGLDLSHPFPRLVNKSINFIVSLEGTDAFGRNSGLAIVHAPKALPAYLQLPEELGAKLRIISAVELIELNIAHLFPGMTVTGCYQFRLTRNSDVFIAPEGVDDLPRALKGELFSRRFGRAVRLEIAQNCPSSLVTFLKDKFQLQDDDIYCIDGEVNLSRLLPLIDLPGFHSLRFAHFTPSIPAQLSKEPDLFRLLMEQDILLHHPFQSFAPVVDLVKQSALDPQVLGIKQTLYRTGLGSANVQALIEAARSGKEVTVVIELRARFDEADNMELANRLQEAGAMVVYGIFGYKTHAKMTLITRREEKILKHYVHLGSGNYHNENAKNYTDFSLLTSNEAIGSEVHKVFLELTGMGKAFELETLLQAPFSLQKRLIDLIQREVKHAKEGKPARIIAKINGLSDQIIIQELYKASQAGVSIDLIVRGMCCLKPGVPGVSENITVRSCVGRFLEHARVYYFQNDTNPDIYCASADWMERNVHYRIELAFPILDKIIADRVLKEGLMSYLGDQECAWILQPDGQYLRKPLDTNTPQSAQDKLLSHYAAK